MKAKKSRRACRKSIARAQHTTAEPRAKSSLAVGITLRAVIRNLARELQRVGITCGVFLSAASAGPSCSRSLSLTRAKLPISISAVHLLSDASFTFHSRRRRTVCGVSCFFFTLLSSCMLFLSFSPRRREAAVFAEKERERDAEDITMFPSELDEIFFWHVVVGWVLWYFWGNSMFGILRGFMDYS